jgi:hypothetical protein
MIWLPTEPAYRPPLSVQVKNQIIPGVYEPIVGYFSIDLEKPNSKKQSHQKLQSLIINKSRVPN